MALSSTGITTSLVGNAIGSSSRNVGALCSSSLINEWSKWKPISSNVGTMTLAELKNRNYGISILSANTPDSLVTQIKNNSNLGYKYNKPIGGIGWEILETMTIRQRCLLEQAIKMVTVLMLVVLLHPITQAMRKY